MASVILACMAVEWILLVAGTKLHEMIVGALSLVACVAFLLVAHRSSSLALRVEPTDLAQGWRIPWYMLVDVGIITAVLVKDLTGREQAGSFFRVSGFTTSERDPRVTARGILATLYTTVTPNSIVLGIDSGQSRMLFHQIKRTGNSTMVRELGAKS